MGPSNMKIGLCWYSKGTDHSMVVLETIIALASTTYIVDLDAYELQSGGWKSFQ